jgi:hypothetical protein
LSSFLALSPEKLKGVTAREEFCLFLIVFAYDRPPRPRHEEPYHSPPVDVNILNALVGMEVCDPKADSEVILAKPVQTHHVLETETQTGMSSSGKGRHKSSP